MIIINIRIIITLNIRVDMINKKRFFHSKEFISIRIRNNKIFHCNLKCIQRVWIWINMNSSYIIMFFIIVHLTHICKEIHSSNIKHLER